MNQESSTDLISPSPALPHAMGSTVFTQLKLLIWKNFVLQVTVLI
jgi:hypothetical protein